MSRFGRRLALLGIGSLAIGTLATLLTKASDGNLSDEGDAFWYGLVAARLHEGDWFVQPFTGEPTAAHPPLAVLALWVTAPLSTSPLTQRLTMTAIGAVAVLVIGLLGRQVAGERAGLLAAGLAAVAPSLWINQTVVMSEALAAVLYAGALLGGVRLARQPSAPTAAWTGAVVGLAVLTRAEAGLLLPLLVGPVLLTRAGLAWRRRLAMAAVAGLAAAAVVAPWTWSNVHRFEEPVLVTTTEGGTLAGTNCHDTYYTRWIGSWRYDCVAAIPDGADESLTSARMRRAGIEYARDHLDRVPVVVGVRIARPLGLWAPGQLVDEAVGEGRPVPVSWAGLGVFWATVPLAVAGAFVLRRRGATLLPYGAALGTVVISAALFHGYHRHRLPLDIAALVLAAVALDQWWSRSDDRADGEVSPGAAPLRAR